MDEERKRADEDALKYRPFNIQWLDSSYQQTCLPDSPWQKVSQFEWFLSTKQKQNRFSTISNRHWQAKLGNSLPILNDDRF